MEAIRSSNTSNTINNNTALPSTMAHRNGHQRSNPQSGGGGGRGGRGRGGGGGGNNSKHTDNDGDHSDYLKKPPPSDFSSPNSSPIKSPTRLPTGYPEFFQEALNNSATTDHSILSDNASVSTSFSHLAGDTDHCLVCYTETLPSIRGITPCGHDTLCGPCHLRLRFLHNDRKCPVCKTVNDRIVVDKDDKTSILNGDGTHHRKFDEYEIWGDELGSGYTFLENVGMFFRVEYYETDIVPFFSLRCTVEGCDFTNESSSFVTSNQYNNDRPNARQKKETKRLSGMKALNEHLRTKHSLTLCHLCVGAKRDFVSFLPRFTASQLKVHQSKGDGDESGFKGHPLCEFCRPRRFYDLTKLHEHLNKDHYKCHVCEKQGKPNQFFKNYDKLALHFDREHFLCHDPQCLAARFVVFENEIDLRAHEVKTHGGSSQNNGGSTKIQLEFRVRRTGYDGGGYENQSVPNMEEDFQYGLDGEAFVPDALPRQENEPDITDSNHAARTAEIREAAARVREEQRARENQEVAFPSLGEGAPAAAGLAGGGGGNFEERNTQSLVGWTADGRAGIRGRAAAERGVTSVEAFPSLPSAPKRSVATAATRAQKSGGGGGGVGGGVNSQFSAMRVAAAGGPTPVTTAAAPAAGSWASSASAAAPAPVAARPAATGPAPFVSTASAPVVRNRASDLTPDNFPSLGGGPKKSSGGIAGGGSIAAAGPRYAAADAFARKNAGKKKQPAQQRQTPPGAALSNMNEFPPPPTASATAVAKKKQQQSIVRDKKPPSKEALANVLHFPPPQTAAASANAAASRATLDEMKSKLGPAKYKKLKSFTKDFASNEIDAEQYVDRTSTLFDNGLNDEDFWSFVPGLIVSCPNEAGVNKAMRYLDELRLANGIQEREYDAVGGEGKSGGGGGWASAAAAAASSSASGASVFPAPPASAPAPYSAARAYAASTGYGAAKKGNSNLKSSSVKKKNAWGSGGGASARAKAPPGGGLAAAADVQMGTATKYMAKVKSEERKQKQLDSLSSQGAGAGKKAKQKKKNDELRALAFGGK